MPDFYYYAVMNNIELLFLEFTASKDIKILKLIKKELSRFKNYIEEIQSIATEVSVVIFNARI